MLNGSLYVAWDNPGGKDWAEWVEMNRTDRDNYQEGFEEPFKPNAYLNLGAEYKWSKNTTLQITGHNLMGLIEDSFNKRRYGFDGYLPAKYRIQPVAFSIALTHRF
jgi:hypothetical protein